MDRKNLLLATGLLVVFGCSTGTGDVPPDQLALLQKCDPYKIARGEEDYEPPQPIGRPPLVVHRNAGHRGVACIILSVDAEGVVTDAEVVYTDNPVFSKLALQAARKTRFEPATMDGVAVSSQLMFPLSFGRR